MDATGAGLRSWLEEHGLAEHTARFEEHGVDLDVLADLDDEDLRELGLSLGDRKRIRRAIEAWTPTVGEPVAHRAPERRQLTVMFVDLVDSTALSARLDPEEMREVLRSYHDAVMDEVGRIEGFTAKLMGDGVLAYFGWPRAHENEAERAVLAGLAICETVGALHTPDGEALAARVGIATGLVVVGDLIGTGAAQEEAVVGETPNLAARLQAIAQPGAVVVAESTRELVGDNAEFADLGTHELKGMAGPVRAYRAVGVGVVESRFRARRGRELPELCGRDAELMQLREHWRNAVAGDGRMVLVSGESGIGKSRLVEELLAETASEPHLRVRYQCSPYHRESELQPVVEHLRRAARLHPEDSTDVALDKIDALTGTDATSAETGALLAGLLGVNGAERYGPLELSPQQLRHRMLGALTELWTGMASEIPLLWVIEDLHWVDPTTLEFVERARELLPSHRALAVVTARPVFDDVEEAVGGLPTIHLDRLGADATALLVTRAAAGAALDRDVVDSIVEHADGVPLFAEETTKAVVGSGSGDGVEGDGSAGGVVVPSSLHDSLMSRLDRLGAVKQVAQTAAVIGRSFDRSTLAVISEPDVALDDALGRLVDAELVLPDGEMPAASYRFNHALVREAAYESLLKSTRADLHGRVADAWAGAVEPELLAHHQRHAGRLADSVDSYLAAGSRSSRRGAFEEAARSHRHAADVFAEHVATHGPDPSRQLRVEMAVGWSASALQGWASTEANQAYESASSLATAIDDRERRIMSLAALAVSHGDRGAPQLGIERAEEILALESPDPLHRFLGHAALVMPCFFHGEHGRSLDHADRALETYDESMDGRLHAVGGSYWPTLCRIYSAWNTWYLGDTAVSDRWIREALRRAPLERQPFEHCYALVFAMILAFFRGDDEQQRELADRTVAVGSEYGFRFFWGIGGVFRAHGWAQLDPGPERVRELEAGLAMAGSEDHRSGLPTILDLVSRIQERLGAVEEAAGTLAEAQAVAAATHQHYWEPELQRRQGDLARARGDFAGAGASYRQAIELASSQGAVALRQRAAASLATLATLDEEVSP